MDKPHSYSYELHIIADDPTAPAAGVNALLAIAERLEELTKTLQNAPQFRPYQKL